MKSVRIVASVVFLLVTLPVRVYAETELAPVDTDTTRVDRYHRRLSRRVLRVAEWVNNVVSDTFRKKEDQESGMTRRFYGNLLTSYQVEGSHIRVKPRIIMTEGSDNEYKLDFSTRLRLHGLSDRLRLYVDSYDTDYDTMEEIFSARYRQELEQARGESAAGGLTYFFTDRATRQLSLSTGLRFRPEPSPKARLRARYRKSFDVWRADFSEGVFWSEQDGFGKRTEISMDRPLRDIDLFRLHATGVWSEVSHGVDWGLNAACYTRFSSRRSGALHLGARGYTHPSWVTDQYLLRVSHRQRIHRDWLFLEIEPGLDFFREDSYKTIPLIHIKFEIIFGDYERL